MSRNRPDAYPVVTPSGVSDEPLREGDVVGRFRHQLMIDIGTVGPAETIRWTRKVEPRPGDEVQRIPV
jgi:hypothetical protein